MVTVDFDDVSLQKYGPSIISSLLCSSMDMLMGVFRNVPNSYALVTLFDSGWFLLILILVSTHCIMPVFLLKMHPYFYKDELV